MKKIPGLFVLIGMIALFGVGCEESRTSPSTSSFASATISGIKNIGEPIPAIIRRRDVDISSSKFGYIDAEISRGFSQDNPGELRPSAFVQSSLKLKPAVPTGNLKMVIASSKGEAKIDQSLGVNIAGEIAASFATGSVSIKAGYTKQQEYSRYSQHVHWYATVYYEAGYTELQNHHELSSIVVGNAKLDEPDKFFENFGTHYVSKVYWGRYRNIRFDLVVDEKQTEEFIKKQLDACASYLSYDGKSNADERKKAKEALRQLKFEKQVEAAGTSTDVAGRYAAADTPDKLVDALVSDLVDDPVTSSPTVSDRNKQNFPNCIPLRFEVTPYKTYLPFKSNPTVKINDLAGKSASLDKLYQRILALHLTSQRCKTLIDANLVPADSRQSFATYQAICNQSIKKLFDLGKKYVQEDNPSPLVDEDLDYVVLNDSDLRDFANKLKSISSNELIFNKSSFRVPSEAEMRWPVPPIKIEATEIRHVDKMSQFTFASKTEDVNNKTGIENVTQDERLNVVRFDVQARARVGSQRLLEIVPKQSFSFEELGTGKFGRLRNTTPVVMANAGESDAFALEMDLDYEGPILASNPNYKRIPYNKKANAENVPKDIKSLLKDLVELSGSSYSKEYVATCDDGQFPVEIKVKVSIP